MVLSEAFEVEVFKGFEVSKGIKIMRIFKYILTSYLAIHTLVLG